MTKGSKIVVIKGSRRGRTGVVLEVSGTCAGEPAVHVCLHGKRCSVVTFYPMSELAELK